MKLRDALLALTLVGGPLLVTPTLALAHGRGAAKKPGLPVAVAAHGALDGVLAGEPIKSSNSVFALRTLGKSGTEIVRGLPLLMRAGESSYEHVVLTTEHVIMKRKDGVFEVTRLADALTQIRSGQHSPTDKVRVGLGPRGFGLHAENGPAATYWLYRQLPQKAHGEIASSSGLTSFALSVADAYHPFGQAGRTVALAVPKLLFDRAAGGEIGGAGWTGHGVGIDVLEEIQFDSVPLAKELRLGKN